MNTHVPLQRPEGVTVIALYQFIAALGWFFLTVILVIYGLVPVSFLLDGIALYFSLATLILLTVIVFLAGVVNLWVGFGLWRLKNWARWATLALSLLRLVGFPVWTVIGGLSMAYLLTPQAQQAFEGRMVQPSTPVHEPWLPAVPDSPVELVEQQAETQVKPRRSRRTSSAEPPSTEE
jgi:hypothetical protein